MLALSFVGATAYELRAATTAQFHTSVAASRRAGVPPPRAAILDSPEDLATPEFEVVLADPETAREMQCHMLETVDDGAQLYASMTPVDTPVAITALRENMMVEVDDPALLEALLPSAAAVCAEMGLTLMDTPVTLTVAGELPDPDDGDGGDGAAADGSGGDGGAYAALDLPEADDAEDDEDGAEVLLGFRHDDAQYYVVRLLDPVFVVGKQVATSRFEIPSEREVERVAPALEEVMAQAATELLGDE